MDISFENSASQWENCDNNAILYRLDTRLKLVLSFLWSILLASLNHIDSVLIALCISFALIILAHWSWRNLVKRLIVVNAFIVFLWIMLPFSFSSPGRVIASIGFLDITYEGVHLAALITIKANAMLIAIIALLCTTPLFTLATAAKAIGVPEKLTSLFLLTFRYSLVILQEYTRLRIAMQVRAFNASLNRHSLNCLGYLVGSLLVRSFDRSERIHRAMLCRGYNGTLHMRTNFKLKKIDYIFATSFICIMIFIGVFEWNS